MALNARQQAAYQDLSDLYSTTRNPNTDGKGTPGAETVTLAYSDVRCHYQWTPNVDDTSGAGRINRMTLLTTDMIHFDSAQEIKNGWWVRCKTPGANFGIVHKVLGEPTVTPGSSRRRVNKQSVEVMVEEHPPEGIP